MISFTNPFLHSHSYTGACFGSFFWLRVLDKAEWWILSFRVHVKLFYRIVLYVWNWSLVRWLCIATSMPSTITTARY